MDLSKTRPVSNTVVFSSIFFSVAICFVALIHVEVELHAHRQMLRVLSERRKEENLEPRKAVHDEPVGYSLGKECQDAPLGMETGAISDAHVTASSEWYGPLAAVQGRLNFKEIGDKYGSWSARFNNGGQWLQVDLGNPHTKVTGVATQGRNGDFDQWVIKYKLQYSLDGVNFYYYKDHGQSETKEFVGNADQDTVVYHKLSNAIRARYIRFRPTAWYRHISMRMEVYGCQGVYRKQ